MKSAIAAMNSYFHLNNATISIETLFESIPVAVALLDRDGRHLVINQALAAISGLSYAELIGRKVADLSKESGENIKRDFAFFDAGKEVPDHEVPIGDQIFLASVKPIRDSAGFAFAEIVALTNITTNKENEQKLADANQQLHYMASHDALTGLLRPGTYYSICDQLINIARRETTPVSALFIDIDHFKNINDTYVHNAGDNVLKSIATCIASNCRTSDIASRVGGEEFSVFLPQTDLNGAFILAENLRKKIEQLMPCIEEKPLKVTASIGVATKLNEHQSIVDIQRDADFAMYQAKNEGRNRVACHQPM